MHYQGISYQHHHIPDFEPPAGWPWKKVGRGRNEKGIDCSNFTSFAYNIALGIKPNSDVKIQAGLTEAPGPGAGVKTQFEKIGKPGAFEDCSKIFRTGDLLFIRGAQTEGITHVIFWVGAIGQSADHGLLILDSTSSGHKDSNGQSIPDGVNLRSFTEKGWYFQRLSHALRVIPNE